jgi:hypothetical protein
VAVPVFKKNKNSLYKKIQNPWANGDVPSGAALDVAQRKRRNSKINK